MIWVGFVLLGADTTLKLSAFDLSIALKVPMDQ
jgi:hypothetical protein